MAAARQPVVGPGLRRERLTVDRQPNTVPAPGLPVIISAERPARVAHSVFVHSSHSPGLYEQPLCPSPARMQGRPRDQREPS
jgi:hypothetical protein